MATSLLQRSLIHMLLGELGDVEGIADEGKDNGFIPDRKYQCFLDVEHFYSCVDITYLARVY